MAPVFGIHDPRQRPDLHGQLKATTQERDPAVAELARLQSGNTRHAAVTVQADDLRKMLDALVAVDVNDPAVMVRARMLLAQLVDPFDAYPQATGARNFAPDCAGRSHGGSGGLPRTST